MKETLNLKSALEMLGGEKELLVELLQTFVNDKHYDEKKLIELEKNSDTIEAAKYVHYFKGAGRQIGAEKLGESGQALEDVLRLKTTGNIESLTKAFSADYELTVKAVNEALELF